jgi:hypothetical protein
MSGLCLVLDLPVLQGGVRKPHGPVVFAKASDIHSRAYISLELKLQVLNAGAVMPIRAAQKLSEVGLPGLWLWRT